jgi:hypothetical protein
MKGPLLMTGIPQSAAHQEIRKGARVPEEYMTLLRHGRCRVERLSFNPRFVNEAGDDLVPGKIHTIRQNFDYWKRFEGRDVALFIWEGKPYQRQSRQKVFCVKRLVYVQKIRKEKTRFTI